MSSELAVLGGTPTLSRDLHRAWPDIRDQDREAVLGVLNRGLLTGSGSVEVPALERGYGAYVGSRHCLAFNSGTAALHACAVASDMQPGDEAIVPAFTYVASAMALCHQGVHPIFCDVDERTYNLDPSRVEERITSRTRAIVPVHLHGLPCDLDAILEIAERHGLEVIEDIAQAHGAEYHGQTVGTFGRCAAGSLNATKNLPGGEGGLFLTNDDACVVSARRLRYMGEDLPDIDPATGRRYWSHGIGWNYRPHELPAALARSQLTRLDEYNHTARRNAAILTEGLAEVPGLLPPPLPDDRSPVWYVYRVVLSPGGIGYTGPVAELRDRVMAALTAEGVRVMIWQHHPLPAYAAFRRSSLVPWQPHVDDEPLAPWDPDEFPSAARICEASFILGSAVNPLAAQDAALMRGYVEAVAKVFARLSEVVDMPFTSPPPTAEAAEFHQSRGLRGVPATRPV